MPADTTDHAADTASSGDIDLAARGDADRSLPLDPIRLPLWGSRLIEASAGTGKTWTIAALYLRLVLGHGDADTRFDRPLAPSEILVMTFTRAATRELSDRIRRRLLEAARCFRGESTPSEEDVLLHSLMDAFPVGETRALAAWRLAMAAESMDDAAIHTIDAWCQRMLREHAFDSGNLFEEELMANEKDMLEEAARDYWRQQIYPLSEGALARALVVWPTVESLMADVRQLQWHSSPEHADEPVLETLIGQSVAERREALQALKAGWDERSEEMRAWLEDQLQRRDCPFDRKVLKAHWYTPWLDGLRDWALDPELERPAITDAGLRRLSRNGMHEACNPLPEGAPYRAQLQLPAHFEGFEKLQQSLKELPDPDRPIRLHAAACVVARLDLLKRQAGTYGFKDLVDRLEAALRGPNAENLRRGILKQYPVALVDEFQDTSPTQYAIFDSLYRAASNDRHSALFLIGDPKQSIYAFRGADIESYLTARRATQGRHYMLGTNFRSTHSLVSAVNGVFDHAERLHAAGAFMFRQPAAAEGEEQGAVDLLPFEPVTANGRPDRHVAGGASGPSMRLVYDTDVTSKRKSQKRYAERCAEDIVRLLNDRQAGFDEAARLDGSGEAAGARALTPLRPADIAVLVRDRFEAESVRADLRARGVASVYLSDQDSVFGSDEAKDLLHWLRAVEQPRDLRLVRAALATRTVGLELAELAVLAIDDEAFEARAEQIRALHEVWLKQGVLTMLRQTLHLFDMPARWLAEVGGERRLTNFLHLAELVQSAAGKLDGEMALIHWLRDQIEGDASTGGEQIVRLESDADLVQVITVYKSKGLEYPLVYLPFACAFRGIDRRNRSFVAVPDGEGGRDLDFGLSDASMAAADRERLKEDLRLLYVALTRAQHAVWVGAGAIGTGKALTISTHRSALGYLLGGGEVIEAYDLERRLRSAFGAHDDIELVNARSLAPRLTPLQPREPAPALADAPAYSASFQKNWSVGSFSAMVRHIVHLPAGQVMSEVSREEELLAEPLEDEVDLLPGSHGAGTGAGGGTAATTDALAPWHRFPRGALPGNFLHDQLEWLAGEGFALRDSPELQAQLQRRCERQGWGHKGDDVVAWLSALTVAPLGNTGASLASLGARGQLLPEMEFWFPSEGLDSRALDQTCVKHLLGGRTRPALPRRTLQGMLMGFADLVFEHEGRYWVLDYKSNALGEHDGDYKRDALEAAMAQHRYDVQAALYLLALHRLLRQRLGDSYRPEEHLGGAVYLFLRGFRGPVGGSYVVPASLPFLGEMDAVVGLAERLVADEPGST